MKIDKVKKMDVRDRFLYWIREREGIRIQKEANKPKPWTDDEILQSFRFCNVRRADDKVSKWLWENWYTKENVEHGTTLRAAALARFVNLPESLGYLGFPKKWNALAIKKKLRKFRDAGNTVFNGAYMVRGNDGMDKIECVVDYYVSPLKKVIVDTSSMEKTWGMIHASYGFGSFMAGQVTADLRWAYPDGKWNDRNSWAPIGPGSRKGMNIFHGRDLKFNLKQEQFNEELMEAIELVNEELPTVGNRLEAIDVQNCYCEFSKYERTLCGEGKPKSRYQGV